MPFINPLSKILILGKDGQLGRCLANIFCRDLFPGAMYWGRTEVDLSDYRAIEVALQKVQPDVIINAAAYTSVDQAETDVDIAYRINCVAVGVLASYCANQHIPLVHYSSDYVFNGAKVGPYFENDLCAPNTIYGRSKYDGELVILKMYEQASFPYWILRASWIYGPSDGLTGNFIKTIIRLALEKEELFVVADQVGVPTSATWLAGITKRILESFVPCGTYHVIPQGHTTWHGLAARIVDVLQANGIPIVANRVTPILSAQYPVPAKRPSNSVMSSKKLSQVLSNVNNIYWQSQVDDYLIESINEMMG